MKKGKISLLVATCLIATSLSTGVIAYADEPVSESVTKEEVAGDKPPVIKVSKEKFLIEKGSAFDLAKELALSIIDDVDNDLTSQVKIPTIDTEQVGLSTFNITATDKAGNKSELAVKINVISFLESKTFENFDQVKDVEAAELVNGNKKDLTISVENINAENSTFDVAVSDGVNKITKTIKATDKDGKPFGQIEEAPKVEEEKKDNNVSNSNLPKTGDLGMVGIGSASLITLLGAGYFIKKRH